MTQHERSWPTTTPRPSATFDDYTLSEIRRAAATGIYDIRGGGSKRRLPNFDDLLLLGASMSRYPLEGYREKCGTEVVLGNRFAKKPLKLSIPITIAGSANPDNIRNWARWAEEPVDQQLLAEVQAILAPVKNIGHIEGLPENN